MSTDFIPNSGMIKRNVLAYGYSPIFEVQWIPVCETDGLCYSINFYNNWKEKYNLEDWEIRRYTAINHFSILPSRHQRYSECDLKYEYCPGCFRPIYLQDAIRLNYLLGHEEPKRVSKRIELEGLEDFL